MPNGNPEKPMQPAKGGSAVQVALDPPLSPAEEERLIDQIYRGEISDEDANKILLRQPYEVHSRIVRAVLNRDTLRLRGSKKISPMVGYGALD